MKGLPHHQRCLVVIYDLRSKWPEVAAAGTVTSGVQNDILDSRFDRWGLPKKITTDNVPQMVSHKLCSYLRQKGIWYHILTAFYNPRLNQSLKNGIRAHLAQGYTFNTSLLQTLRHYRATPHATTGVSSSCWGGSYSCHWTGFVLVWSALQCTRSKQGSIHVRAR